MKDYIVVYKLYKTPGTGGYTCIAQNKHDAKLKFMSSGIKYDYIIKIIR